MVARSKIVDINRSIAEAETDHAADDAETGGLIAQNGSRFESYLDSETAHQDDFSPEWEEEIIANRRPWGRITTMALLVLLAAGWTGFFGWANFAEIASRPAPARMADLVATWSLPIAMLAIFWLLAMRLSSTEAKRFGDVAALLRQESDALESRMRNVNGEISLARSFLAENARELESVGRLSAQRLTEAAGQLTSALSDSDERAQMLQVASNAAVTNLEQLRNHLPIVTTAAKDATNQIGIAGNTAHGQIQAIIATLRKMNDSAAEAGETLSALDIRIDKSADQLSAKISHSASTLSDSVEGSEGRVQALIAALDDSLISSENRLTSITAAVDERVERSSQKLAEHLDALQSSIERVSATTGEQEIATRELIAQVGQSIEDCRTRIAEGSDDASDRLVKLAFAVAALSENSTALQNSLGTNNDVATRLIEQSETLEQLISGLNIEVGEALPKYIDTLDQRFADSRSQFAALGNELSAADNQSAELLKKIEGLETLVSRQRSAIDGLLSGTEAHFSAQHEQVDALSSALAHTRSLMEDMSGVANDQLVASLLRVRETTRQAAESSRKIVDEELASVADRLTEQNKLALESAVDEQVRELDRAMGAAMDRNLRIAQNVEERISAQMQTIDEMAGNLELRVERAHASFGGLDDEGFARRMALLTESLNSAAIDVAKILSNEVTDTAWAAYLKGDRGVFTRRAVRLLDSGEAKIIASHYDDDAEFRDHVNRYIHDFEAMMRVLLSTRDGNAIGVTLLSSDVGKLYVALAQAIERLRN